MTFSPNANFTDWGAPWSKSCFESSIPHRILMTALCPPMGFALPWRIRAVVTPPDNAR